MLELQLKIHSYCLGLRAVTVLYGNMASVYGIHIKAVNASSHTVQYGRRWPYIYGSATKGEHAFLRSVNTLEDKIKQLTIMFHVSPTY